MQNDNISILIPDGEHKALRSILNCLSKAPKVKIIVLSNKNSIYLRFSLIIFRFIYFPPALDIKRRIKLIEEVAKVNKVDVILPISEDTIQLFLENKLHFQDFDKLCPLPGLSDFLIARNKDLFSEHLTAYNIPIPKTIILESNPQNQSNIDDLSFPILAKPTNNSGGGLGIKKLSNINDLKLFFKNRDQTEKFILQEFISGYDLGVNVLCFEGKILSYTIQKGFLWGKKQFTSQIGLTFENNNRLLNIIENLTQSLNWTGVANIDVRFDEVENQFKILEMNPRYWDTIEGSLIAGVNFPYLHCLSKTSSYLSSSYNNIEYVKLQGLFFLIKKQPKTLLKVNYIWNHSPIRFLFEDPVSIIFHYMWTIKRIIMRKVIL